MTHQGTVHIRSQGIVLTVWSHSLQHVSVALGEKLRCASILPCEGTMEGEKSSTAAPAAGSMAPKPMRSMRATPALAAMPLPDQAPQLALNAVTPCAA